MSNPEITSILQKASEGSTGYIGIIESDHAYIHKKKGFALIGSTTIGNGASYKISFTTPDPEDPAVKETCRMYVHWRPALIYGLSGGLTWFLYEGSTGISGGSPSAAICLNRNNPPLANTEFTVGTTVTGNGTNIQLAASGSAGNPARTTGGGSGAAQERVLKANTEHTLVINNLYAGNNLTTWELFFYEEENGVCG